jgi:uncharacterized protein (DUF1015 family)
MSRFEPFVGLLFDPARVGSVDRVSAPPYDVISEADRQRFVRASPFNVVRILLGDASSGDSDPDAKYRSAGSLLRRWRIEGALVATEGPRWFPYEMRFQLDGLDRRVRGLICAVVLEDAAGAILPHEETTPGPIEDRLRLTREARANLSCIEALVRGPSSELSSYLIEMTGSPPAVEVLDEERVLHRLWIAEEGPDVGALETQDLVIADGHHRFSMYLRYRDEMRRSSGAGPWDRVMALVVDAASERPPVFPYHRMLRGEPLPLDGDRVGSLDELLAAIDDESLRYGTVAIEGGDLVHRVAQLSGRPPTVLAVHRDRLDRRLADLTYTPDPRRAEATVQDGDATLAYLMPATSATRIHEVVDQGTRLPRKATFFWPKPRTGLVIRPLDADRRPLTPPPTVPRAS